MPIKSVLPGWPSYMGSHKFVVAEMKGLAAYTSAAHEIVRALQFGGGGIEFAEIGNKKWGTVNSLAAYVAFSYSGTYFCTIEFAAGAVGAQASMTLKWYVTATGAEANAIDLSAETIRLFLIMV